MNDVSTKPSLTLDLDDEVDAEEPTNFESTSDPPHNSQDEHETPVDAEQLLPPSRRGKRRDSRVRFEPEEKMVRCAELPSPWDNAPATNKIEAATAYRESCKTLKVRPLSKVIQLVQSVEDFKKRCDVLDLRGVRLDNRSCEALESLFKRLQFLTVNFDNCGLEDDGAMAIFEMLDFYDSAHRLVLARNPKLSGRGWLSCSRMMKKSHCITFLDVRECVFDDFTIPLIGRPIRANCVLKTLHIEGNELTGRTHLILVTALKTNFNLTELFLGNNRLVPDDMAHLGSVLKMNSTLQLLDLRDNLIGDQGLSSLCEGLWEQHTAGLTTLVLWNNRITAKGMQPLAVVLPTHPSIETLNLGNNRIDSSGCQTLKSGLVGNRTLKRLGMVNCRITCEGAIALAEVIGDNKPLQRLDLRDNDVRLAGLLALSLAHRVSHNLVRLDLKKTIRSENRDQELIKKLLLDIETYGQRNKIEVEEREAREAVLLRQKALEDEKTKKDEAVEQERRSEALDALSTALHAQALVEDHGLPTKPKEKEKEIVEQEVEKNEEENSREESSLENGVEVERKEDDTGDVAIADLLDDEGGEQAMQSEDVEHSIDDERQGADSASEVEMIEPGKTSSSDDSQTAVTDEIENQDG